VEHATFRQRALHHLVAATLCSAVLIHGARTTADLDWPPDPDHFRDLAQAQTIQDGGWLKDPFYREESLWYNPMLATILAAISSFTGRPIHVVGTRAGAYLNILAALTFYALVVRLANPAVALTSLVGFLFLIRGPTWAVPTYSPWLFASIFAQPFFYLTLLTYYEAVQSDRQWRFVLVGVLLGLTFLSHTAPAIVAGICILAVSSYRVVAGTHRFSTVAGEVALIVGLGVLVALPFLWSIVGHYQLRIKNPVPLIWRDPDLPPESWQTLWTLVSSRGWFVNIMIVLGLGAIVLGRIGRHAAVIVLVWLAATSLLFIYNHFLILRPTGFSFPPIVPAHHFLVYERAAEMVVVGLGLTLMASGIARISWRAIRLALPGASLQPITRGVYAAILVAIVWITYPTYLARAAFVQEPAAARRGFTTDELRAIVPWIRANSGTSDVFLTSDTGCLSVVGPAGRKCMLVPRFFSNPYVDWEARRAEHRAMWDALTADDCARFQEHAHAYRVKWVMTVESRTPQLPSGRCGLLPTTFPGTHWRIYRLSR
jgi:hypothetical protein